MTITHSKKQLEDWLLRRCQNDYSKYEQCNSDITILEFNFNGRVLDVLYQFWSNQSLIDKNSLLFNSEISERYDCNLPEMLIRVTFKDSCEWKTQEAFDALIDTNDLVSVESEYISSEYFEWDDLALSEEVVIDFWQSCDPEGLRDMFKNEYDNIFKDIPKRLFPYVEKIING